MKHLIFLTIFAGFFIFFGSCKNIKPHIVSADLVTVAATEHSQNNEISTWLSPFKKRIDEKMGIEIGFSAKELGQAQKDASESLLGNFILDVMNDYAKNHGLKVDFTITNRGGLRGSLPQGTIKVGNVYEVFPFDNELVVLTLPGKKVEQLCGEIALQEWQITDGIAMCVDNHKAKWVKINNAPIDTLKNYSVLTTDYLSFGNDELFALKDYTKIIELKAPLRQAIIDYIKNEYNKGKMIDADFKNQVSVGQCDNF